MAKNHLTVGIYANGDFKYNIVRDCDLANHIEYNKQFRFGRLLYVDGERVYNGCMTEDALPKFDKRFKEILELLGDLDMSRPTIPYR